MTNVFHSLLFFLANVENIENVISDNSELAKIFNGYFTKTVIEFGIKSMKILT